MSKKVRVGLVGLGFMGQMHFGCYANNPGAQVVAVCDEQAERFAAGAAVAGNIEGAISLDFSNLHTTRKFQELLENPAIDLVDLCLPTPLHAQATVAALEAGKHVLCEKPMAPSLAECNAMTAAAQQSGKVMMIGHCLRFWPQYVASHEMIRNGQLGRVLYARFHRSTEAPKWSDWMLDGAQSGGAALDTHIHDVDTALWWFGKPDVVEANSVSKDGLSLKIDSNWHYEDGLQLDLHCGWDTNGGPFRMSFEVMGETATLSYDSALSEKLQLSTNGKTREIEVAEGMGYQYEIDYLVECIQNNKLPTRETPQSSRLSIEMALWELEQSKK